MTAETRRLRSACAADTERVGADLAAKLAAGDVVLLEGELGAGKTTFVRGACRALGVTAVVTSPTFTLGQRYDAPIPVSHLDLYRVADLADEDPELLDDYVRPDAIAFIEWPHPGEAWLHRPVGRVWRVALSHAGADRRAIEIEEPR